MNRRKFIFLIAGLAVVLWLAFGFFSNPEARVHVVDASGKPVRGALIRGEGLGTKPGPTAHGWRNPGGWGVANPPRVKTVITDRNGVAHLPYPSHLLEDEETGSIKLLVDHPDFVPDHSERFVAITCPRTLSWKPWSNYLAWRFGREAPIVLQKGAGLAVKLREDSPGPHDAPLYVQVSGWEEEDTNVWVHPQAAVAQTRQLPAGTYKIRAVAFDADGCAWFSDVFPIKAVSGQTNEFSVVLKKGITVHGELDLTVPRPVANGRVTAMVWPKGMTSSDLPPHWHTWAGIRADGAFELRSLPPGDLEIAALCDGFVSMRAKGQVPSIHYAQRYDLGTNDTTISPAMESTATLDVEVRDNRSRLLKNAVVSAWPTTSYGGENWQGVGVDCFYTADRIREGLARWRWSYIDPIGMLAVSNYQATTDVRGRVLLRNLPVEVQLVTIEHRAYVLPTIEIEPTPKPARYNPAAIPQKLHFAKVALVANETNHTVVRLERRQ